MTKQNPDILCHRCQEFDYIMNRKGTVSMDVFVICECDDANELIATRILGRRARKEIPEATAPFLIDRK